MKRAFIRRFFVVLAMRILFVFLSILSVLASCSPSRQLSRDLRRNPDFSNHLTGFVLYDPTTQKTLLQHNGALPFTPASNTKLVSFFAGLTLLGDSIPALRYVTRGDSLLFWGTGNPLLLNPDLTDTTALSFLRQRPEKLFLSVANYSGERLGAGWAWDDYSDDYSPEITPFPLYGNIVRFTMGQVSPRLFVDSIVVAGKAMNAIRRDEFSNRFSRPGTIKKAQQDVPFRWSPALAIKLLSDTLKRTVQLINQPLDPSARTLYGFPTDSLYKRMLHVSDNMLAEHLLLLCADRLNLETLNQRPVIQEMTLHFQPLSRARWVDGSGLSRYNLFTPRLLVTLLDATLKKVSRNRLFALLPAISPLDTRPDAFPASQPYLYAKSGSMTGVYNLSGYLLTRKGNLLIFSMMHNNFTQSVAQVRKQTAAFLDRVRQAY